MTARALNVRPSMAVQEEEEEEDEERMKQRR